ncbi:MAG: MnhB domain-containing protein [Vicinamibacterales bacterium]|jgi:multicomponent Na+:H+ antiporter subunit B|nr:sodium:proton antiporter [Acidobacteriota bacterium]MDP6371765.1 MnhB domain-containing protein [Vicinamibacterales bacterium]MDP6608550.1 MnhB domain-containing protein [Vicinamibacterales bacterium]HAK56855.1 sodium:proton antiporter [Acidobacteriota bacterium]|tara:strand:- start:5574 stop:6008 length:435 start_codon:yes stop_codon:yes gene_type:complete
MNSGFGSPALDAASRLMTPFMLMFGAYVVVHGHDSPGGGFQGGVIIAACLILVRLVRGRAAGWVMPPETAVVLLCTGAGIFAGVGLLGPIFGGHFLDYSALPLTLAPAEVRAAGSLAVEIGVALAVTGVLELIFDVLVEARDDA